MKTTDLPPAGSELSEDQQTASLTYRPYEARRITYQGVRHRDPWRLKLYTIVYGVNALCLEEFEAGLELVQRVLPDPNPADGRPGVGVLIAHAGRGADYIVLGWWDRENELPVRVVVRDPGPGAEWRPASGSESFCVWDLQVLAAERDAYVATVLSGLELGEGIRRYLEQDCCR